MGEFVNMGLAANRKAALGLRIYQGIEKDLVLTPPAVQVTAMQTGLQTAPAFSYEIKNA